MKFAVSIYRGEDGLYTAACPCLPGCSCKGQTRQEAKERLEEAIRGYLAAVGEVVADEQEELCVVA